MVRVKICGITRPLDAWFAAEAGADAIGIVFATSPRHLTLPRARRIIANLPPWVDAIGVFAYSGIQRILRFAGEAGLSGIQLHGDHSPADLRALAPYRVVKAIRVRDASFVDEALRMRDAGAAAILLDSYVPGQRGGTGKPFDWRLIVEARDKGRLAGLPPIILAGGLTPLNVASAIRQVQPWGVDVSGGVEKSPGAKDTELMRRFISAARSEKP